MAKDTEKLIRQLSLISYLMAERRPVTALEIRRDVEGYCGHERGRVRAALLRRPRRARVARHPADASTSRPTASPSRRTTRCAPETFHLPAIEFTDAELAALQTALTLLDGEFAYAEPLRLALQQISWGRPSPLARPTQRRRSRSGSPPRPAATSSPQRLAKIETAIFRRKTIDVRVLHDGARRGRARARSTPTTCSSRAASSTSSATRTSATACACSASRASAARSPTRPRPSTTSSRPADFDPRAYANRIRLAARRRAGRGGDLDRPSGSPGRSSATSARYGELRAGRGRRAASSRTDYAIAAAADLVGAAASASTRGSLGPPELVDELAARVDRARSSATAASPPAVAAARAAPEPRRRRRAPRAAAARARDGDPPRALRPPRHARLDPDRRPAARARRLPVAEVCERLQISDAGAARGHQRAQRRQLRRRLLRPLRRGRRATARSRSTPSPTATPSPARRGCCRSRPRRSSPRST